MTLSMGHTCRCDTCREERRRKAATFRRLHKGTEPPVHGTRSAYTNYGCRCDQCREANRRG